MSEAVPIVGVNGTGSQLQAVVPSLAKTQLLPLQTQAAKNSVNDTVPLAAGMQTKGAEELVGNFRPARDSIIPLTNNIDVLVELAVPTRRFPVKNWEAALSKATLADSLASATVPMVIFEPLIAVKLVPATTGRIPPTVNCTSWLAPLKVLP